MIDFIEYVVSEIKSKRLSKTDAVSLVKQFSVRPAGPAGAAIHPLLQRNTSDLSGQRYSSTFNGDEFFLADHEVRGQKVLPGVAYLEMIRAAIEDALPETTTVKLHNTVWAQPVVVNGRTEIHVALLATESPDEIDYEVYSGDDVVHCQGRAILGRSNAPRRIDLESLSVTRGTVEPRDLYAACARMGLVYGPSFRSVTSLRRGDGQLLAQLRVPDGVADEFALHPSLLDGALQSAAGLFDGADTTARVPFALETLRIVAPCSREMVAWVRYAAGSQAGDSVVKLDIDLCDVRGNVCVQLHGFSWRAMAASQSQTLFATPVWEAIANEPSGLEFAERHVIACDGDYSEQAVVCFEKIQSILQSRPAGKVLVQVVTNDPLLLGLSGLLKTAALENPQLVTQIVLGSADGLQSLEPVVRRNNGAWEALHWREVSEATSAPAAFKEGGVYLITGGTGAIGTLFANEIRARGGRAITIGRADVDLTNLEQLRAFINGIGPLDGVIHAAGTHADEFILKKSAAQFAEVLKPKVAGTLNLDEATKDLDLDFFVMFAAVAGAMGNPGQSDYAAANAFLDQFAAWRNEHRRGLTRAIDWPLWQHGGMTMDAAAREQLRAATGMQPMQTATGIDAFHRALAMPHAQTLVVEGDLTKFRKLLHSGGQAILPVPSNEASRPSQDHVEEFLRNEFSPLLKIAPSQIDPRAALENYGIDSILAMKLTNQLEATFGSLPKTLFFEYQTIRELAAFFAEHYAGAFAKTAAPIAETPVVVPETKAVSSRRFAPVRRTAAKNDDDPIAIVGLSGRYPEAVDIEAYWSNLRDGKDCITEVPKTRWNWREYFSEDRTIPGNHYSKWGGFIEGVDEFDSLFFNISPAEAEMMDPQERLFLQHAWMAVEDAGYTRASLQIPHANDLAGQVGVYVGVMYTEYQLFGAEATARGKRLGVVGSMASIANRVSYALNLHGPSMTIDTMCSSSLTAVHVACEDLKRRRTSLAIAGGVNVTIHPNKYLVLSAGQFISSDGHCQSFGEGGDGYIPGEGVGVVILKRLSDAKRDGDHIYGVIRGSALSHGGKTNGYSVPNPQAQASVISRALAEGKVDARQVSYVEAHGTGTKLGDPIEIAALTKAFQPYTQDTRFCAIGSAKSNIGHCEGAAGIAGLTKVLLQLQHRKIVPSLHSAKLNPHIDFDKTPFVVNQELRDWEAPVVEGRTLPRIAGISSFGAGGSNAHVLIEEYVAGPSAMATPANVVIVLSARTAEQLEQKIRDLVRFVRSHDVDLASLAYTLQTGREAMDERLAFTASTLDEVVTKLERGEFQRGAVKRNNEALSLFATDTDLQQTVAKWIATGKLAKVLDLWVTGLDVDWNALWSDVRPQRASLPAYPFARERHWIDVEAAPAVMKGGQTSVLHPLLHSNTSDLSEQRYSSTFTGDEFFLAGHRVKSQKVLPGVAYLEMARAAIAQALPAMPEGTVLELHNSVWAQPVIVDGPSTVNIALLPDDGEQIDYEIFSGDAVHGQGSALFAHAETATIDLDALAKQMSAGVMSADDVYAACARRGLEYGPQFRAIAEVRRGEGELLAKLRVGDPGDFVLHPALLDGALQAAVAMLDGDATPLPFALDTLRVLEPCAAEMFAWVRRADAAENILKLDVDLCDARGNVCVQMHGFTARVTGAGRLYAAPIWEPVATQAELEFAERHVVVCDSGDYAANAIHCFERIQEILQRRPQGKILFRVVVNDPLFLGLSGLLKSAAIENPNFTGQVVLGTPDELHAYDAVVRNHNGVWEAQQWREVAPALDAPIAFKEGGVYLITGGSGALGTLFADEIRARGGRAIVAGRAQVDLDDLDSVRAFIAQIGPLNGVIHAAGMVADRILVQKSASEFADVLKPKVAGTINLDEATKELDLDFFVLFSSLAGATGNAGQGDYAAANAFMDRFAAWRNEHRRGITRSINWPLWRSGGMTLDAEKQELLQQTTGMQPLETATGIDAFHRALAMPHEQLLVVEGDVARIRRALLREQPQTQTPPQPADTVSRPADVEEFLRNEFAPLLKLPAHKLDPQAPLENYGIDSVLAMRLTNQLEKTFGSLPKTLFFEYQTIAALAGYFVKAGTVVPRREDDAESREAGDPALKRGMTGGRGTTEKPKRARKRFAGVAAKAAPQDIAIIGVSGRYPQAANLDEFWRNLRNGRDSITEIPAGRWDHKRFFDADKNAAGKTYSKWGGFIDDVDKFDPLFFNISPREASLIDPQERLFLETAWHTIEDAGYTKDSITGSRTGVYVGVMWGQYELFGAEALLRGATSVPASSHASIANRVSYYFDLHGPSIALDTMCSSSLTAIHLACDALRSGEIDAAIAGGVNLTIHPYKYLSLSQGKFVASDGRCRSFGAGGDGYVPGEGVGAVLLKPLDKAVRDGDQIYAVIKSSSVNHGGKTNGYTVPNPNAQGELILDALKKANVDPSTLAYIETHGTGTSLGDPIEIAGLMKAFGPATDRKQFCPIGSVKSNIGHLESAAGIAAVTKVLLQLRHDELVPSLHAEPLNPNIDFAGSPFYVQTQLAEWKRNGAQPRRVGVSSFGAGGSNAHLILEEFVDARPQASSSKQEVFVLSAKNIDALRRYAQRMIESLDDGASLAAVAYTAQTGRTPLDVRLAVIAASIADLRAKLTGWLSSKESDDVFQANVRETQFDLIDGEAGKAFVDTLLGAGDLRKLARLWTLGAAVDWSRLARSSRPRKVSLPAYPFAKERYWIEQDKPALRLVQETSAPSEPKQRVYYAPQWTARAIAKTRATTGPVLVIGDELRAALERQRPDATFSEGEPAVIVYHVADGDIARAFDPLFELSRRTPAKLIAVFSNPLAAAAAGFLRTLTLEDPRWTAKAIDMPVLDAAAIWDEIDEDERTTQEIRYRDGQRLVRELAPYTPVRKALPLKRNGVYLITGGTGGLGSIFADHLAKTYAAKLVLISRNATPRETGDILVMQADVTKLDDVQRVVAAAKERFGRIDGVIHAAGVNRDAFILRKTREQIDAVLAPKIQGAVHLDLATRDEQLDFFALFASIAGVTGNVGQCDYAYANRFLDAFAETRGGRTLSIDWPLWADGGMSISADDVARLEASTGITPMPAADGIACFEDFLAGDATQAIAFYGVASRIAAHVAPRVIREVARTGVMEEEPLAAKTETYLKTLIGAEIQLEVDRIGSNDPLESFGIDSVIINKINTRLEDDLGALPKTLLYEHETVRDLARFLAKNSTGALSALFGTSGGQAILPVQILEEAKNDRQDCLSSTVEEIAIVGIHGHYPHSPSLDEYWENLKRGRELIDVVPAQRWNYEQYYDADPAAAADGKIYCKWGGFLDDYDKFDPHFFKISTAEAVLMDPQERLFLESVWAAIEDAGYTRETMRARFPKAGSADVGVFVGVTTNTYNLWAPEERNRGNFASPSAMPWSIANRVSYFFDFNGPSMPVDTACSSSLVAIHLACEALRNRDCQVAIAGGVNLYLHPAKYLSLCQRRSLSLDGKCHSYGAGDDGFVPGEGVGTLVLKPLRKAVEDQDRIYAVIRASAYDHSGRSNGYSAPNPNAQAGLISRTLEKAGIHPETIGYIEGHGTGTQLGDSLEIAALTQAFRKQTDKTQFCPIGSVKANTGHAESAAGIAGVAKVVLQLQHRQLAPSIHSEEPNPNIEFHETPFYLQHGLSEWTTPNGQARRALVNSFGAGGVNACVVLEEWQTAAIDEREAGPYLFTLSARNEERLREYADRVLRQLRSEPGIDLASLCYTLQAGRDAMEERLAMVVSDAAELFERLGEWRRRGTAANVHRGTLGPRRSRRHAKLARTGVGEQGLIDLAVRWVTGEEVDWDSLYSRKPRRMSAPTYPFARERYWVADAVVSERAVETTAQLHPLVTYNSSTLREVSFTSSLSDSAFYAVDHKVHDERIFPGAGFLEMACIAANIAGERKVRQIRDVVWIQPLSFRDGAQSVRTVLKKNGDAVDYVISSFDEHNETVVHSEGRLAFGNRLAPVADERISIQGLKEQGAKAHDRAAYYDKFRAFGLQYGPAFQSIQELYVNGKFALAKLRIAKQLEGEFGQFILHPSIVDGALQTIAGLVGEHDSATPFLPFAIDELDLVRPVPQTCYAYAERADERAGNRGGITKFNIRLLNESGDVLVRIKNLYVRPLARPSSGDVETSEPLPRLRGLH